MKNKSIIPTANERVMRENDFIVSRTDTRGIITYCNPIFIEFSGYSERELLGSQHNIVRHPDMPRSAFALAWQTIQSGNEFFAYVKNMSKDGGFYWVFTHITPDFNERGEITGYFSVRRAPRRDAIEKIAPVYAQMLQAEKSAGPAGAIEAGTRLLSGALAQAGMEYEQLIFSL